MAAGPRRAASGYANVAALPGLECRERRSPGLDCIVPPPVTGQRWAGPEQATRPAIAAGAIPRIIRAFAPKPSRQTIPLQDKPGGERTGRERTQPGDRCADRGVRALNGQALRFGVPDAARPGRPSLSVAIARFWRRDGQLAVSRSTRRQPRRRRCCGFPVPGVAGKPVAAMSPGAGRCRGEHAC
jgi:hypothetical protein